jgi:hypothetical protein
MPLSAGAVEQYPSDSFPMRKSMRCSPKTASNDSHLGGNLAPRGSDRWQNRCREEGKAYSYCYHRIT